MMQALFQKMTNWMLWWLVIAVATLIIAIAALAGAYAHVVWKANEVSYEGQFGTFTAKIDNFESQIQNTTLSLDQQQAQLKYNSEKLEKLLNNFKKTENKHPSSAQPPVQTILMQPGYTSDTVTDLSDVVKNLKTQSNSLIDQRQKLEAIGHGLQQVKQELNQYSEDHKKIQ